jgi:DnaK suppressor protein
MGKRTQRMIAMTKNYKTIKLDPKYTPKKTEKYMSEEQKAYFYNLLNTQRAEVLTSIEDGMTEITADINIDNMDGANDEGDNSSTTQQAETNMKMLDRDKNLLIRIDNALERLEQGTYGYSVISGDEIGIKRMMASPFTTLTIEEKEEQDSKER